MPVGIGESDNGGAGRSERCLLCRRPLGGRSACEGGLCTDCAPEVAVYLDRSGLSANRRALAIRHLWEIGVALGRYGGREIHHLPEFSVRVPTYYGNILGEVEPLKQEFDEPFVPVLLRGADGVRIVLGSHDYEDLDSPDIQVERRPNGWAIFLHPVGSSDPTGIVYFLDDKRSFLLRDRGLGATPRIRILRDDVDFKQIDLLGSQGTISEVEVTQTEFADDEVDSQRMQLVNSASRGCCRPGTTGTASAPDALTTSPACLTSWV